VLVGSGISQI